MKPLTLTNKIQLSLVAGFFIAVGFAVLIIHLLVGREMLKEFWHSNQHEVEHILNHLDASFKHDQRLLENLALQLTRDNQLLPTDELIHELGHSSGRYYFSEQLVITTGGTVVADLPRRPGRLGADYSRKPYINHVIKSPAFTSEPIGPRSTNNPVAIDFHAPILNSQGDLVGILTARKPFTTQDVPSYALHSAGNRHTHTLSFLLDGQQQKLIEVIDKQTILSPLTQHPQGALLHKIQKMPDQQGRAKDLSGRVWVYTKGYFSPMGWLYISLTPEKKALEHIYKALITFSCVLVLVLLLLAALLHISIKKHMTPLQDIITQLQARMREKNTTKPILAPDEPEFQPLVATFNELLRERELQEKNKDEFLATISHELRTPLTSIKGALAFIKPDTPVQDRLLDIASRNTDRAALLISDLLDLAAITKGELRLVTDVYDLSFLIDQVLEEIAPYAAEQKITVQYRQPDQFLLAKVDPDRFKQVLTNLLSNAIKFSDEGGEVFVDLSKLESQVRIGVADRGQGIPDAFKPYIFQRFAQAEQGYKKQRAGSGLGLSISNELIKAMGGTLAFNSVEGQGSYFYFELAEAKSPATQELSHDA